MLIILPPALLLLTAAWVAEPEFEVAYAPASAELTSLTITVDPTAVERHFITLYSDGPFAFIEDDEAVPPTQEAPVERLPDRADEGSGAAR